MNAPTPPPPPPPPEWATYCSGRRPAHKMHKTIGQAKNAINCHKGGTIFHMVEGEWVEIGTYTWEGLCDVCSQPLPRYGIHSKWDGMTWVRHHYKCDPKVKLRMLAEQERKNRLHEGKSFA